MQIIKGHSTCKMRMSLLFSFMILLYVVDADVYSDTVCEGQSMTIQCPDGATILVHSAMYGRVDAGVCPGRNQHNTNCNNDETALVAGRCNGQTSCTVPANNDLFGDPCGGTHKYLDVDYSCGSRCHSCTCKLFGDPQLTACNGTTIHVGLEDTSPYDNRIKLIFAYDHFDFEIEVYAKLSHIPGLGPNHLKIDYVNGYVYNGDVESGVVFMNYWMNETTFRVTSEHGQSANWETVTTTLPSWAASLMNLVQSSPGCYEFKGVRDPELGDIGVKYCDGCLTINMAEDMYREDGACQQGNYSC